MKNLSLEIAAKVLDFDEVSSERYLSQEMIDWAVRLAESALQTPIGYLGHMSGIGDPHQYWVEACPVYKDLSQRYPTARPFCFVVELANWVIEPEYREREGAELPPFLNT